MNPFDRLRQTINSVSVKYVIPEQDTAQQQFTDTRQPEIANKETIPRMVNIEREEQNMFEEKQANLIREINSLSLKNERMQKQLKSSEIQKNQLLAENCQLQKNSEVLENKLKQAVCTVRNLEQKEKKYKEEIHRINNTVEQLGIQLNNERQSRKKMSNDLNVLKEETMKNSDEFHKKIEKLEDENNQLRLEIQERMKMLEFNIKKSTDDKKEQQTLVNALRSQSERKIALLNAENKELTEKMYSAIQQSAVLQQKFGNISEKHQKNCLDLEKALASNQSLNAIKNNLQQQNRILSQKYESLEQEVQKLSTLLEEEKKNVKLKVVEIRDQTLELQLQMYRRQCKELLQQKMLRDGSYSERLMPAGFQDLHSYSK